MSIAETSAAVTGRDRWLRAIEASASGPVEVAETDLSWVYLTERHAYKIKKPVDVGEARYRSAGRRRLACLDELWLNRRLAAGAYLGVMPITLEANGELRLGGRGEALEWAIKMRRLRADRSLLWLIKHDGLTATQIALLAETIGDFYRTCPPQTIVLDELCARLRARIEDRRGIARGWSADAVNQFGQIRTAQSSYLDGARMILNMRMCDGRVVDGHGDLRPEHVFFERRPVIIDCAEYSPARRITDALDDLSALTMECQRLGRDDVADAMMAAYRQSTGDDCFPHLEAFYRSLHACARAASAVASADDLAAGARSAESESYLAQAQRDAKSFS